MDEGNKERARELGNEFEQGRISRRDFIRMLTALGLSISATGLVADTALTG
jgi:hypothetical protein